MNSRAKATDFWTDAGDEVARRQYRDLLDTIDEGLYHLGPDGHFVAVNDAFVAATGYSRDDLLGEHISLVLDGDDVERLEAEIRRQRKSFDAVPVELTICTAREETIPCVVRVDVLVTDGDFRGTLGLVRRAGESQHSMNGLVRSKNDLLTTIINETSGACIVFDETFTLVWADERIGQYFGIDQTALVGRDKREVVDEIKGAFAEPERFATRVLGADDDNSHTEKFECRVTGGRDREDRWLEHRGKPIRSGAYAGGRIECYTDVTDQRRSVEQLEQAKRQFATLVDAVDEYAIFRLDVDGTVSTWNTGARNIKGYESREILGKHFSRFYTQEDRTAGVPERNLERAAEEGSIEDEGWRVRQDGSRFWANVTIVAIRDENDSLEGYLKITRDMTETHEYQRELESELHHTLNRVSDAFMGLDEEWQFTYINDRAAELIDIAPGEAEGEVLWEVFPEAVGSTFEDEYRRAMREQVAVSFEEYFPPTETWFEVSTYPSETGLSVYFRDVTERREREQQLRQRERELEEYKEYTTDILDAIDDLFYVVDREGNYRRWNESLTTVTGYSDDEIEAMNSLEFIVEEDRERVAAGIEEIFETGDSRVEATVRTKTGEHVPIEFVASALTTPDGERVLAGIGRDITERKHRQQRLKASNERLEQFAYAASHDLQEPLRMVSSYLRLIDRRYSDTLDKDGQEFLEFAVDGADRMRDMIDGLLAYSRIESQGVSFEAVDLDDIFADARDNLSVMVSENDAEITVDALPRVEGDRGQLCQLFQNLLDNAMTYSGQSPPRIHVSAERDGSQWVISVRDEGIGIDPDDADRIFQVFQSLETSDSQGSGIGLALCKRIVERHGGDIWVDSSPGEGATFSFTLPAAGDDDE